MPTLDGFDTRKAIRHTELFKKQMGLRRPTEEELTAEKEPNTDFIKAKPKISE